MTARVRFAMTICPPVTDPNNIRESAIGVLRQHAIGAHLTGLSVEAHPWTAPGSIRLSGEVIIPLIRDPENLREDLIARMTSHGRVDYPWVVTIGVSE